MRSEERGERDIGSVGSMGSRERWGGSSYFIKKYNKGVAVFVTSWLIQSENGHTGWIN
jgi:hypothetical protein